MAGQGLGARSPAPARPSRAGRTAPGQARPAWGGVRRPRGTGHEPTEASGASGAGEGADTAPRSAPRAVRTRSPPGRAGTTHTAADVGTRRPQASGRRGVAALPGRRTPSGRHHPIPVLGGDAPPDRLRALQTPKPGAPGLPTRRRPGEGGLRTTGAPFQRPENANCAKRSPNPAGPEAHRLTQSPGSRPGGTIGGRLAGPAWGWHQRDPLTKAWRDPGRGQGSRPLPTGCSRLV